MRESFFLVPKDERAAVQYGGAQDYGRGIKDQAPEPCLMSMSGQTVNGAEPSVLVKRRQRGTTYFTGAMVAGRSACEAQTTTFGLGEGAKVC